MIIILFYFLLLSFIANSQSVDFQTINNKTMKQIFYPYEVCLFRQATLNGTFQKGFNECMFQFKNQDMKPSTLPKFLLPCISGRGRQKHIESGGKSKRYNCLLRSPNERKSLFSITTKQHKTNHILSHHAARGLFNTLKGRNISTLLLWGDSVMNQFGHFLQCDLYRSGNTTLSDASMPTTKSFSFTDSKKSFNLVGVSPVLPCTTGNKLTSECAEDAEAFITRFILKVLDEALKPKKRFHPGNTAVLFNTGLHMKENNFWAVSAVVEGLLRVEAQRRHNTTFFFMESSAQLFAYKEGGIFEGKTLKVSGTSIEASKEGFNEDFTRERQQGIVQPNMGLSVKPGFCCDNRGGLNNTRNELFLEAFRRLDPVGRVGWIPIHQLTAQFRDLRAEAKGEDCTHFLYSPVAYAVLWEAVDGAMRAHFDRLDLLRQQRRKRKRRVTYLQMLMRFFSYVFGIPY